jgi:hypothetical protein
MAAPHQGNDDPAAVAIEQGRLDDDDVGNGFPLFSCIPVNVELRHYSVECWSANEPLRSLKEFQVFAATSARLSG